jgi:saccharopine dehydrogenase-like NADP-dependent oxidoreductase
MAEGTWFAPGVRSPEELNPDPFLQRLPEFGMAWHIRDELTGEIDPVPHSLSAAALAA